MTLQRSFRCVLLLFHVVAYSMDVTSKQDVVPVHRAKEGLVAKVCDKSFESAEGILREKYPNTMVRIARYDRELIRTPLIRASEEDVLKELQNGVFMMCSVNPELQYHIIEQMGIKNPKAQQTMLRELPIKDALIFAGWYHEALQESEVDFLLKSSPSLSTEQLYCMRDVMLEKNHSNNELIYTNLNPDFTPNDEVVRKSVLINHGQQKLLESLPEQFVSGDKNKALGELTVCERVPVFKQIVGRPLALFSRVGYRSPTMLTLYNIQAWTQCAWMLTASLTDRYVFGSFYLPESLLRLSDLLISKVGYLFCSCMYSVFQAELNVCRRGGNVLFCKKSYFKLGEMAFLALSTTIIASRHPYSFLPDLVLLGFQMGYDLTTCTIKYDVTPMSVKELWDRNQERLKKQKSQGCSLL